MANKDLRYFMREEAKVEQIVTVPGPESIKDENDNVIQLEIKQLHNCLLYTSPSPRDTR